MMDLQRTAVTTALLSMTFACSSSEPGNPDAGNNNNGTDTTPPMVASVSPADQATGVVRNTQISATFDEPLACTSVNDTTLVVSPSVAGSTSCSGATITFAPGDNLAASTEHTVTILPEVKDEAGNTLASAFSWRFTTSAEIDDTPPVDPTITAPSPIPGTTPLAQITVSGTKEANASIEGRWLVDGTERQAFQAQVAVNAETTWSHDFALVDGVNRWVLRSRDAAGNVRCGETGQEACSVEFSITKTPNQQDVDPPTVEFVAVTSADRQVLHGTKETDRGIVIGGNLVVPVNGATTWDAEVVLSPGANTVEVRAQDGFGNVSAPVPAQIERQSPGTVPGGAQLRVSLEVQDLWDLIGDEFEIDQCATALNHYSVDIWVEGPFAYDDNGTPGNTGDDVVERCAYDNAAFERRHTRYTGSVIHMLEVDTYELWLFPDYFASNLAAALIESGHYENAAEPIAKDADRKDSAGNTPRVPPCGPTHVNENGTCRSRLGSMEAPAVDGVTSASIRPFYDRNTGLAMDGSALGAWSQMGSWTWDMTDRNGQRVQQGAYLVSAVVTVYRSDPAQQAAGGTTDLGQAAISPYQWNEVLGIDRETCWDNSAHDTIGDHRAEGIVVFNDQEKTLYWEEKGHAETVDAPHNERAGIRFNGQCDWDGPGPDAFCTFPPAPDDFGTGPECTAPNSSLGQPVKYLKTPAGWPGPVRVEYCPNGC